MKKLLKNPKFRFALFISAAVILVLSLVLTVGLDKMRQRKEDERLVKFEEETRDLQVRKQNLLVEYANVEKYYLRKIADGSFTGVIVTELNPQLYNDIFPMFLRKTSGAFREIKIFGYMALYEGNMPGDEGCITREQFDDMVDAGWRYVLYWDGEGDLQEYIPRMRERFSEEGLTFPNALMFKGMTYSLDYDEYLKSEGIVHALHHGEDELPFIEKNVTGDVWHPGVVGWNMRGYANAMLNEILGDGGAGFYEVNFTDTTGDILFDYEDYDRASAFGRMIDVFEKLMGTDELDVTDFDSAWEGRKQYVDLREEVLDDVEKRRREIVLEIEEIDKEINEIYLKYYRD